MDEIVKVTIECVDGTKQEISGDLLICGIVSQTDAEEKTDKFKLTTALVGKGLSHSVGINAMKTFTQDMAVKLADNDEMMVLLYLNNLIEYLQAEEREKKRSLVDKISNGEWPDFKKTLLSFFDLFMEKE